MSSDALPGGSSVKNKAEISPARREHERYLLDLTGLSQGKTNTTTDNAVNFSMNFTGIPDEINGSLSNDPQLLESQKRKVRRYSEVIAQQRSQLARLSLHCQRLESYVMKCGREKDFRLSELSHDDVSVQFTKLNGDVDDNAALDSREIRRQCRLQQQLAASQQANATLTDRCSVLLQCLQDRNAHRAHGADTQRWLSGVQSKLPNPTKRSSLSARSKDSPRTKSVSKPSTSRIQQPQPIYPKMLVKIIEKISNAADATLFIQDANQILARQLLAERATIFRTNWDTKELWSVASNHLPRGQVLRVSFTAGISGATILRKEPISLVNASRDARFDVDIDLSERALMCVPILHPFDRKQPALGLLQFASKLDRTFFSEYDQSLAELFAAFLSMRIVNNDLVEASKRDRSKFGGLFRSAESLMMEKDVSSVVNRIVVKMGQFSFADYVVLLAIDPEHKDLIKVSSYSKNETALRLPAAFKRSDAIDTEANRLHNNTPCLSVVAARSGESIQISNSNTDHRFNTTFDEYFVDAKTSGSTGSLLVQPLKHSMSERVVGVLVFGKREKNSFSHVLIKELEDFYGLLSVSVLRLNAYKLNKKCLNNNIEHISELLEKMSTSSSCDSNSDHRRQRKSKILFKTEQLESVAAEAIGQKDTQTDTETSLEPGEKQK